MTSLADRVDVLERELAALEPAYVRAKARVKGEDAEWETRKAGLIRQMSDLVSRFKIGDEPHKAVAIVAQASVLANELRMPEHWVAEYEDKKQLLRMAQQERERMEEVQRKAKEAYENQPWRRQAAAL